MVCADAVNLRYSVTFDEEYRANWDNLPIIRNETVTSFVWRNSLFYNAMHVDNPNGGEAAPAAVSTGQMRNCFTRIGRSRGRGSTVVTLYTSTVFMTSK